jgi:hypothetical protein
MGNGVDSKGAAPGYCSAIGVASSVRRRFIRVNTAVLTWDNGVLLFDEIPRPSNQLITFNEKRRPIRHEK